MRPQVGATEGQNEAGGQCDGVEVASEPSEPAGPAATQVKVVSTEIEATSTQVKVVSTDMEAMSMQVKVMSTEIEVSLLRGISTQLLLRRCGASFSDHELNAANYAKSFRVQTLNDFVSHDWASGAFSKVLALCLIYNSGPAVAISLTFGALVAVAESPHVGFLPSPELHGEVTRGTEALYYGYWCQALCPVVFFVIFFFWQDVRATLRLGTRSAFLDKYCIDQTNAERKAKGILSLGGFLRHTERFIILWTPRYFTRLWCTYEVASWLALDKPLSSVLFMPLSHARSIVVGFFTTVGICTVFALGSIFFPSWYMVVMGAALVVVVPGSCHFWRRYMHDLRRLPMQLQEFSIFDAACFCCSHSHRMPNDPNQVIPCDREVVQRTVALWFSTDAKVSAPANFERLSVAHLHSFDAAVQNLFGPWVLQSAGPTRIPYKYVVLIGIPLSFRMLDVASTIGKIPSGYLIKMLVGVYPADILGIAPTIYKLTLHVICLCDSCIGTPENRCVDLVTTLAMAASFILIFAMMWVPLNFVSDLKNPLPTFLVAGALFVVTALTFGDELRDLLPTRMRNWGRGKANRSLSSSRPPSARAPSSRSDGSSGSRLRQSGSIQDATKQVGCAAKWAMCDSAVEAEGIHNL